MSLPYAFSNLTAANGGMLDSNFAAVAALGVFDGTVAGTNALTFTQGTNQPVVAVYTNNQKFAFTAGANSTSSVTLQVGALAALPVYLPTGVQAGNGSISNGSYYELVYLAALNSGNGGFAIISAVPASGVAPVLVGSAQALLIKNNGSVPTTSVDISAKQAVLQSVAGTPFILTGATAPSVTVDLTITGANGMSSDGARPTSGWVYLYLISTGAVTAGLGCITSPTAGAPTLPGGYSYSLYVGAMYCDGSRNLMQTRQLGRSSQYIVTGAGNAVKLPLIGGGTGAVGTWSATAPTLVGVTVQGNAGFVPLTASSISINVADAYVGGSFASVLVAPSAAYSGANNGPRGSNGVAWPFSNNNSGGGTSPLHGAMLLESASIYWATNLNGGAIECMGWDDYYVNA